MAVVDRVGFGVVFCCSQVAGAEVSTRSRRVEETTEEDVQFVASTHTTLAAILGQPEVNSTTSA